MSADEKLLIGCLDGIEQQEARLLVWGLVDVFLTSNEVGEIVDPLLDQVVDQDGLTLFSVADVVNVLIQRALLFEFMEDGEPHYRSRMAEAVRLFFHLRQLFPKHRGATGWQSAPNLVADFRFILRRRRYPDRPIPTKDAQDLVRAATTDALTQDALSALIESFGPQFSLARFQLDAIVRILSGYDQPRSTATLVSAGTGSGKTMAFYLPSLARIASHIQRDPRPSQWVKALAIYPRNELLKDQFAEVYRQARRLDATLDGQRARKILIGTFFGPTPYDLKVAQKTWKSHSEGLVCEFMPCTDEKCGGDLVWRNEDLSFQKERLVCLSCRKSLESDEVILTRRRLESESPDILFTTTEMLNQRMGDNRYCHLFGLGSRCERTVETMLLDEVHTYSGTHGAQVAFLLRRWRQMLRRPVSFVGLSATLTDGQRFFSRLTGLNEQATMEITPKTRDMIVEGAEYLLALRGDPVSRTSLLSTTIQASMLLSRVLDSPDSRKSCGIYGERLFLFADNLDVINRLYFAMLDAEGRQSNGGVNMIRHPDGGLAVLRNPMANEHRKSQGQDWQAVVDIGHTLQPSDRKHVGRVMSMDPGMGQNLDIIVATASLEVGFNDPLVGGVIQHKSPNDVGQFLQRKGRAGRSRKMRPWTVVVLSDYGRDRISYQGYDLLFDPQVPARPLPIGNRYVERIQAVFATMDYLSQTMEGTTKGSVWTNLCGPTKSSKQQNRQQRLAGLINGTLTRESELQRYKRYLCRALRLDPDEVEALLWEHPRPILTEVLPTAHRRLRTHWRAFGASDGDYQVENSPLPEFVPTSLFADLNLPEVTIVLGQSGRSTPEKVMMPIAQALKEYSPGRVSHRYGISHALERHWLCPDINESHSQEIDLDPFVEADHIGDWQFESTSKVIRLPVYRPRAFIVKQTPNNVADTSNARLQWKSQIVARISGLVLNPPEGSFWKQLVDDVRFFTHQNLCPVEARRMAIRSHANIRYRDGTSYNKDFSFQIGGSDAVLGFSLNVDALCVRLRFPRDISSIVGSETGPCYRAIRTARFHDLAINGPSLRAVESRFAREWLSQLMLAAVSNEAMAKVIGLEGAASNLSENLAELSLEQTLEKLFQSAVVEDTDGRENTRDKLRQDLAEYIGDPHVRRSLFELCQILWEPIGAQWESWLRECFTATTASAALYAILSLCPEIDGDGLVVDIDPGPREPDDVLTEAPETEIWISELVPGGNGQIEAALRQYAENPRRFFNLMTAALRDNDLVQCDSQLQRFLKEIVEAAPYGDLAHVVKEFRNAHGASESRRAFSDLREQLAARGYVTFHAFTVALANRVLRQGSSSESDAFFLNAMRQWTLEEERLGVEFDARVIAYRLSQSKEIDTALTFAGIAAPVVNPDQWRLGVIYGLLWPRGAQVRQAGLQLYSPFADLPPPEPLLFVDYLNQEHTIIDIEEDGWRDACLTSLADSGMVTLSCKLAAAGHLAEALNFVATNPVQSRYLSVFARVQGVRRSGSSYHVDLDIAEAPQ